MTTLKRIFLLLALGACLAAAGCGGDDEGSPIPADQATALQRELDSIEARLQQGSVGACEDIFNHPTDPNRRPVEETLTSLPNDVDPDVRDALEQSFENLWSLVERECQDKAAEQETQPEPTPEPEPTTPETTPEETETNPPPTDTQPTTPADQTLPPDGDGDNDGEVPPANGENGGGVGPGGASEGDDG